MWFLGFMVMVYIVTQFGNEIVNTLWTNLVIG